MALMIQNVRGVIFRPARSSRSLMSVRLRFFCAASSSFSDSWTLRRRRSVISSSRLRAAPAASGRLHELVGPALAGHQRVEHHIGKTAKGDGAHEGNGDDRHIALQHAYAPSSMPSTSAA